MTYTNILSIVDDTTMTVHMKGYMSWGLKWVTFFGTDLVPISVVFFVDDIWNDLAGGMSLYHLKTAYLL